MSLQEQEALNSLNRLPAQYWKYCYIQLFLSSKSITGENWKYFQKCIFRGYHSMNNKELFLKIAPKRDLIIKDIFQFTLIINLPLFFSKQAKTRKIFINDTCRGHYSREGQRSTDYFEICINDRSFKTEQIIWKIFSETRTIDGYCLPITVCRSYIWNCQASSYTFQENYKKSWNKSVKIV